jgi:hypothetical protein
MNKKNIIFGLVVLYLCIFSFFVFAKNSSIIENMSELTKGNISIIDKIVEKHIKFATKINNKEIKKDNSTLNYLSKYNEFSKVKFNEVKKVKQEYSLKLKKYEKNFEGIIVDDKKYVLDVMICRDDFCYARLNGEPIKIYQGMNITLEDGNILHVKTTIEDYCDKKICDYLYDSYDFVEIELIRPLEKEITDLDLEKLNKKTSKSSNESIVNITNVDYSDINITNNINSSNNSIQN